MRHDQRVKLHAAAIDRLKGKHLAYRVMAWMIAVHTTTATRSWAIVDRHEYAELFGCTHRNIGQALQTLEAVGLVVRVARTDDKGRTIKSRYDFLEVE